MSAFSRLGSILAGAVTATLLAGCSGAALQPATSTGLGAQSQHATPVVSTHPKPFVNVARVKAPAGNQIVIADAASATVTVWGANRQLNAILFDAITSDPRGLTTDSAESIYVANEGSSSVDVYAKPYTAITKTLEDPSWLTMDVAVSKSGVVAVTNYLTTGLAPGSVTFYAKDATTPCATVQDPNWIAFSNEAFDRLGNLFIDGQDAHGRTLVGELSGGCAATSIATLSVGNAIASPGSVQVYRGNILIGDPGNKAVYTYAAPAGGSLGVPTATTTLAGSLDPVAFAIEARGHSLWSADYNAYGSFSGHYAYPAGTAAGQINDHLIPVGIAVNPAPAP
jgi:hypothetical protein